MIISLELPLALKGRKTDPDKISIGSYPGLLDVSLLDPKGVLEKICRPCFRFIWSGMKDHYTLPWEKWDLLA
jgi:hypothetical protein